MKIILCHSILKKEIKPLLKYFSKGDIKKYVLKAAEGLGPELKGSNIPNSKLVKIYMTSRQGAGRMIVLIFINKNYYLPIILRLKKDKLLGTNLSSKNQVLQDLLEKNLNFVMQDLKNGNFEEL